RGGGEVAVPDHRHGADLRHPGYRAPLLLHRCTVLLAVDRLDLLRDRTPALLPHGAVRLQHAAPASPRAPEQGRRHLGTGLHHHGLPRRRRVGLPAYPGSGELLHPRHPADRRPRTPGLFRRLRHDLHGRECNSPQAQRMEIWSCWVMSISMLAITLLLTWAGWIQIELQRLPGDAGAIGYMQTQDAIMHVYWMRLAAGVAFAVGLGMY